jgi:hypothetical protein
MPNLGRRNDPGAVKAQRVVGLAPRPATSTLIECAESRI